MRRVGGGELTPGPRLTVSRVARLDHTPDEPVEVHQSLAPVYPDQRPVGSVWFGVSGVARAHRRGLAEPRLFEDSRRVACRSSLRDPAAGTHD